MKTNTLVLKDAHEQANYVWDWAGPDVRMQADATDETLKDILRDLEREYTGEMAEIYGAEKGLPLDLEHALMELQRMRAHLVGEALADLAEFRLSEDPAWVEGPHVMVEGPRFSCTHPVTGKRLEAALHSGAGAELVLNAARSNSSWWAELDRAGLDSQGIGLIWH